MNSIFEAVLSAVDIVSHIRNATSAEIQKTGETLRGNPAPCCSHRDCFTIYPATNSYKCFSCDSAGDVIHLERLLNGHENNLTAARALAKQYGIEVENGKTIRPDVAAEKKSENPEPLQQERARKVRKIVSAFYHEQLLNVPDALKYQTDERGHSLETLKRFQIGYVGKTDLIGFFKKLDGFGINDLAGIGLIKKYRGKLQPTIPNGFNVYPHLRRNEILGFSIKKRNAQKHEMFQIKKKYFDPEWLCLGQDALNADNVIIVEGENDYLSIAGKAEYDNIICTNGNFNSTNILKRIQKISRGKTFYLVFDNDEAGHKYTDRYATAILKGGGQALKVMIPDGNNDIDEFLRTSSTPKAAFEKLLSRAIEIKNQNRVSGSDETDSKEPTTIAVPETLNIVGEDESGRIVIESLANHKIYILPLRDLTFEQMVQCGGHEISQKFYRRKQQSLPGQASFLSLKEKIIIEAAQKQLGRIEWLGQGFHFQDSGDLLINNGGTAYLWDGKQLDEYHSPLIGLRLIKKNTGRKWIEISKLRDSLESFNIDKAVELRDQLLAYFNQWGFVGRWDAFILAGWFLGQQIQSYWKWRPHLWISGPAGSGKTILLEAMAAIGGRLVLRLEGQNLTEAGLRQAIGNDSCFAYIDELERNKSRDLILQFLRSGGRGGLVVKGSANQKVTRFRIKHMIACGSIETGIERQTEVSRFFVIETKKDDSRDPKLPSVSEAEKLHLRIVTFVLWATHKIDRIMGTVDKIDGYDARLVDAYRVPAVMIALGDPEPDKAFKHYLHEFLNDWGARRSNEIQSDESDLLDTILKSVVWVNTTRFNEMKGIDQNIRTQRTISQLLDDDGSIDEETEDLLAAKGVKKFPDGVLMDPRAIERELLKDSKWANFNTQNILKRLPGVRTNVRRVIAGGRPRSLLIPLDACGLNSPDNLDDKNE